MVFDLVSSQWVAHGRGHGFKALGSFSLITAFHAGWVMHEPNFDRLRAQALLDVEDDTRGGSSLQLLKLDLNTTSLAVNVPWKHQKG